MAQETNQTQGPMLCTTGCGFYGNPRTNGMCSVCYKDYLQRQNNNGRVSPSVVAASSGVSPVGESLPMQLSDTGVLLLAPASPTAGSAQEPSSVISDQTLLSQASIAHSEEDDSTVDKPGLKTDQLQENRKVRGKRKRRDTEQPLDGAHAPLSSDTVQTNVEDQDPSPDRPKKQKNRCFVCRKKVGLTGFDCRCGNVFCGIHRYTDMHSCTFDYKAEAAEKIRKENPVVIAEKIHKI